MTAPVTFGGLGKLEMAFNSAPNDPNPVWTDITQWARTGGDAGSPIDTAVGRQTEFDLIQPGQMEVVLDNSDGRWTPGNTASPLWPNFKAARQIRYSETILSTTYVLFQGFVNFPDVDAWDAAPVYQEVRLSCYDLLGRLARMPTFVSTLGAHILGSAPAANLVGYWTLADAPTWAPTVGTGNLAPGLVTVPGSYVDWTGTLSANSSGPPGDDIGSTSFTVLSALGIGSSLAPPNGAFSWTVAAGQSISVSCWIQAKASVNVTGGPAFVVDLVANASATRLQLYDTWTGTAQPISARFNLTTLTLARPYPIDCWRLVTLVYTPSTGACSLWCGPDDVVSGVAAAVAGAVIFSPPGISIGDATFAKNMSHWQVYVGAPLAYADHLAQWQVGMTGLERQTTGQRITSILNYAGVDVSLQNVDMGTSVMQRARLAGATPLAALNDAVVTEQGRGFVNGAGQYTFHDRIRVYNV